MVNSSDVWSGDQLFTLTREIPLSKEEVTEDKQQADKHIQAPTQAEEEELPEGEVLSLEEQVVQAQAQAEEYLDGWQRARAELSNVKKRVERERSEMYVNARVAVIARFLEIMDDFERALQNVPQEFAGDGWIEGLTLIHRKFASFLEVEGVSEIEAAGKEFDPAFHEALSEQDSEEHQEGQIIVVVQKGYMLGGHVVRPARVIVAA